MSGRPAMSYHVLEAAADDFLAEVSAEPEAKAARAFARHVLSGTLEGLAKPPFLSWFHGVSHVFPDFSAVFQAVFYVCWTFLMFFPTFSCFSFISMFFWRARSGRWGFLQLRSYLFEPRLKQLRVTPIPKDGIRNDHMSYPIYLFFEVT